MCDAIATSVEHAPPKCFFPEGYRTNLITVPSCVEHNEGNSEDVEYVRNVISTQHGTNDLAAKVFEKTKRSLEYSPKLMTRTFRELRPVLMEGEETGAFPVDLARHKSVMRAIAYALYFRQYRKKHRGDWRIFTPTFGYARSLYRGEPDPWERFRRLVESGHYSPMPVPHPAVFKYGLIEMDHNQTIYRFEFYERVVVMAWTYFATYVPPRTICPPGLWIPFRSG
jgi:hypothetical protein